MTRRLAIIIALLAVVIVAGTTPWPAPRAALGSLMRLGALGDQRLRLTVDDRASLTLLPEPRLQAVGVRISDQDGAALTVERASGALRLLPLLSGAFEFADLTLVRPRLRWTSDKDPNSIAASRSPRFSPDGAAARLAELDRLIVIDGETVEATGRTAGLNAVLRRRDDVLEVAGSFRVRGESVDIHVAGVRIPALRNGESTPLSVSLRSAHGEARFTGAIAAMTHAPQAEGTLFLAMMNAPAASRWLGLAWPLPLGETATVKAGVRINEGALALMDAKIHTSAGSFDGFLSTTYASGRVAISGTLAAERLDLTAAMRPLFPSRMADGAWSNESIDLAALPSGDADIRISAGRLTVGALAFDNAALSLLSRRGRADVTLSNGDIMGGRVKGRATVVFGEGDGVELKAQGSFDRIDASQAASKMGGVDRITGTANGGFLVEGHGGSIAAIVRSLDGKASLTVRQGDLLGINLPEVLRRIERRPLIAALGVRGGKTPFDVATIGGRIGKGALEIAEGGLTSPAARVTLVGQVGIGERTLHLSGQAQALEQGRDAVTLPFEISGSFDDPTVAPDARSLIRRSGAAAPLLAPAKGVALNSGRPDGSLPAAKP